MPLRHGISQRDRCLFYMRREVGNSEQWEVFSSVDVCNNACHQRGSPLSPHHHIQAAVFVAVLKPGLKLNITETLASFGYRSSANAVED